MVQRLTPDLLRRHPLPVPEHGEDKKQRGRVLVIAGSLEMPGVALLAGMGALRAGAGNVRVATCQSIAPHLGLSFPEARVFGLPETKAGGIDPSAADRLVELCAVADAVVIGPGMTEHEAVEELTVALLQAAKQPRFVLDAASFTELRAHHDVLRAAGDRVIVTPHAGEAARFLYCSREDVEGDPFAACRAIANTIRGAVVLKGAQTHIRGPGGEEWRNDHGTIGLGTSGSGDTLAGLMGGLLARGAPPFLAAGWGVYVHAEAGHRLTARHGLLGFLARELPGEFPRILNDLSG